MSKVKLIFDLEQDNRELICALYGYDLASIVWEIKVNIIRSAYKNDWTRDQLITALESEISKIPIDLDEVIF